MQILGVNKVQVARKPSSPLEIILWEKRKRSCRASLSSVGSGRVGSGQVGSGQVRSGQVRSGQVWSNC